MATTVTGAIRIGEANGVNFRSSQRASGQSWLWVLALLAALVGTYGLAIGVGWALERFLGVAGPLTTSVCILAAVIINLGVVFPLYVRFARRNAARRLSARGLPNPVPCKVTVDAETFTYAIGDLTHTALWRGVTDLFPAGRFWVVVAQGGRHFVPRRFFGGEGDERAWVAEMLGHMSAAAQARAKEAARFAARG